MERCWWIIKVTGIGPHVFFGTEEQAEKEREVKAEWHGRVARKEPADPQSKIHREMVFVEIDRRSEMRKKGLAGYEEDYPQLTEQAAAR